MDVQVNWRDMHALNSLFISSGLYTFDSQLLQLTDCTSLKKLYFDKVRQIVQSLSSFLQLLSTLSDQL